MPANLNALIRYKTINSCLYGGTRRWRIAELIDACSNALADTRGRYAPVSERTIRDDIRVMRSDILGFNAPIKQRGGLYYYDDPRYSILSIGITDAALVEKIIKMLLEIREEIRHPELEIVLGKLKEISPESFIQKITLEEKAYKVFHEKYFDIEKAGSKKKIRIPKKISEPKPSTSDTTLEQGFGPLFSLPFPPSPIPSLSWGDLLGALV